jgi:hypothetical protein
MLRERDNRTLKEDQTHSYNATDLLHLNPCSGLMEDVDMSLVMVG